MRADGVYRFVVDERGSVRLVVKSDGVVVHRRDYDAWGEVTKETGTALHPFGYAGGLYDGATGLVRFGARDYDPSLGRWLAKDPIGFGGGDSNLYGYVRDNPINFVDPSDLWLLQATGAVFGGGAQAYVNYDAYKCGRISGEQYALSIGFGTVVGVASTIPTSVLGGVLAGGGGSFLNEAFNSGIGAKKSSLNDMLRGVAFGAIAGGLANALGNLGGQVVKSESQIGKPLSHPLETYGELGGSFGTAAGTVGSNY